MSSEGLHIRREKLWTTTLLRHDAVTSLIEEPETDRTLRERLFKDGSITGHEEEATDKA